MGLKIVSHLETIFLSKIKRELIIQRSCPINVYIYFLNVPLLRILWLAHRDPLNPRAGGAERTIFEVGKRLLNKGNEVTILSGGWNNCKKEEFLEGIRIKRYGYRAAPHLILPIILLKNKFDIVIADLGHAVPWIAPILLRRKTVVSFYHLHARSLHGQVGKILAYIITAIEKCYFIIYNKSPFVTISNTSYGNLSDLGIKSNKITIINPGVNDELFRPSNKTEYPSMIYFGGMRPYKRPEEALYLLNNLLKEFNNLRLLMVGDGPSRSVLEKISEDLVIKEHVTFTGRVSEEKLAELVSSAWLNVHSSVTEGWGISIIESASAGTPTVAYEVPGVVDAIEEGLNGIKVKDGDRKALTDAAIKLLKDPEPWWASSVKVANKYSWDATTEKWEELILAVVSG